MIKSLKIFRCRRGATAVEFALIAPVFLLMIAIVLESGRIMWIKNTMQYAVEEMGRYSMVNSASIIADSPTYVTLIEDTLGPAKVVGAFSTGVAFVATYDDLTDPSNITMEITASYTYTPLIGLVPSVSVPLQAKTKVPLNE